LSRLKKYARGAAAPLKGACFAFQKWNSKKLKNELKYIKKGSKKRWIVENISYINDL
jgi:hypothetical protein